MFLCVFIIVKILVFCLATDCQDGWLAFEGSCYWFGADGVHFKEAEQNCRQHSAHLVHIQSSEENNFLKGYINTNFKGTSDYWLGMTDEIAEGLWRWIDDNGRLEYDDWGPTEPQNYQNAMGVTEDCAIMDHSMYHQWADVQCAYNFRALCEQSGDTIPAVVG